MEETNWESLLFEFDFPNLGNILQNESESVSPPISTHSPDEKPIWTSSIGEIEKLLMEDDRFDDKVETQPIPNEFLADLLVDSSPSGCGDEVIDDTAFDKQNQTLFNVDNDDPIDKKQRRIPAVGFPALVPGHHVPVHPAKVAQVSSGKRGKKRSRKSGS
uniref:BZIP domain-containing protein n=1 Tax=Gossypium raimondii TaxID=29730 RepID=A0A0D2TFQ4_GOSRA|nr:hypothetical protein B456_012G007100 [Gossypium raimondii]